MRRMGEVYFGPGSASYDYSGDNPGAYYTNTVTADGGTYPGAGTVAEQQMPVIEISGANWITSPPSLEVAGSDPSEWALPDFSKKLPSILPFLALILAGTAVVWYASSKPKRRRSRR